nr:MAG TPA: hypothetical protein [Bacteriophage sp.]
MPKILRGILSEIQAKMREKDYIDDLISQADDQYHSDFCRLLLVMLWNA